jgi:hypothetical protein
MGLPAGVTRYPDFGHKVPVTQRGWWTAYDSINPLHRYADGSRHFTSCMLAAAVMILERIGYQTPLLRGQTDYAGTNPLVRNLVLALHLASGKYPNGTTLQDTQNAIAKLFGDVDVPVFYGTMSKAEIISTLYNFGIVRISVRPLTDMPRSWHLPAGYGGGGHALILNRRRTRTCYGADGRTAFTDHTGHSGIREIWIVDPMLRPASGYVGQWVPLDKLLSYADTYDGEYVVTWGFKSAAL